MKCHWAILFSRTLSGPVSPLTGNYLWIRVSLLPVHVHTQARECVCIVRSHESLKSATDDISCCWLHIGSGGGAGRHGGQFSGTCSTGLPLPIFFLRSAFQSLSPSFLLSVSFRLAFLPSYFLKRERNRL